MSASHSGPTGPAVTSDESSSLFTSALSGSLPKPGQMKIAAVDPYVAYITCCVPLFSSFL